MQAIKNNFKKISAGIVILLLFIYKFNSNNTPTPENTENQIKTTEVTTPKKIEVITFGEWTPKENRETLVTISSDNEAQISAEIPGTIEKVYVKLGQNVKKGQLIATYKKSSDNAFIQYQNSISNLTTTKLDNQTQTQAAEINIQNAKRELEQVIKQQQQLRNQTFINLVNNTKSAENIFSQNLDTLDRYLGASPKFHNTTHAARYTLGANDRILKQNIDNQLVTLRKLQENLPKTPATGFSNSETQQLKYAQKRLYFGNTLKKTLSDFSNLVNNSRGSAQFSDSQITGVKSEISGLETKNNQEISNLSAQIENAKSIEEQINTSVLNAQNKLNSNQSNLELTLAQNKSRLVGAQNQVNIANISKQNLEIRASIAGKISEHLVKDQTQVTTNQKLFKITNPFAEKKAIAYLTESELSNINTQEQLQIKTSNDEILDIKKAFISQEINPSTQKVEVQFILPENQAIIGSWASLLLPINKESINTLPISAISFEPDGAEILKLNEDNTLSRQKIEIGKIRGNNIEVLAKLNPQTKVVRYQNRANPGQKITPITSQN